MHKTKYFDSFWLKVDNLKTPFRSIVLFLIILLNVLCLEAQQYDFHFITNKDGLPQNTVFDILQDSKGYLWFGTDGGGLCKYDGQKYIVYTKTEGLAGNIVRKIKEDNEGNIYICTDAGLSIFDGKRFTNITTKNGLSNNLTMCVLPNNSTSFWVGTSGGGLNLVSIKNKRISCKVYGTAQLLGSDYVFDLFKDSRNRLWLATFGGGLNILQLKNDSITSIKYLNKNQGFPADQCLSFFAEDKQTVWCNTYDNGIFRVGLSLESDEFSYVSLSTSNGLPDNAIWSSVVYNGAIIMGNNSAGISLFNNGKITAITANNGLQANQVLKVFTDKDQNLWFSVYGKGVCRFSGLHFYQYGIAEGFKNDNIKSILQMGDTVVVASDGGGVSFYSLKHKTVKTFTTNDGLPDLKVNSISTYRKNIVVATDKGIAYFQKNRWNVLQGTESYLITSLLGTSDGFLWFGTDAGLYRYDGKSFFLIDQKMHLPNNYIQYLQEFNGVLWVATLDGLASISKNQITTYDEQDGLDFKKINTLYPYKNSKLLIGTAGNGLYLYDEQAKPKIKAMKSKVALFSKNIKSITKIHDETFLIATDNSCILVQIKEDSLLVEQQFTKENGFIGVESNVNAVTKIANAYWIGTVNGITVYDPSKELKKTWNPSLHITDVKLFFKHINWQEHLYKTPKWFNTPRSLELSYKENHVTISFQALGFSSNKTYYKFLLEGLDKTWSPPRNETEAVYPSLNPGTYTFKVKTVNSETLQESAAVSYTFTIIPPFWKTWWFYLIVTVIMITAFYSFVKFRELQLRKDNERLEKIVTIRTKEVHEQAEIIKEINREITDSIRYSKSIQSVVLPNIEEMHKHLADFFILFKPRDIVSGDFYWFAPQNGKMIVTVADCTGHGVPGAFMSMLGMSFLSEIIIKNGITRPDLILNEMRKNIITALKQDQTAVSKQKDGMDMALIAIDFQTMTLQFAGAHNPLILISNGELIEYKADKMPVGIYEINNPFTLHERPLQKGDCVYLFSDGYQDQFGGPHNRKFLSKRLKECLLAHHSLPMAEQKMVLEQKNNEWMSYPDDNGDPQRQIDDITVWGIRF